MRHTAHGPRPFAESPERQVLTVADSNNGIGSGTLVLSFITGIAAGVAAILLYNAQKGEQQQKIQDQDEQLFI
jgi:hypothetical protein